MADVQTLIFPKHAISCEVLAPRNRTMVWLIYMYTHTKCHIWPAMSSNVLVSHNYPMSETYLIISVYYNVYNTVQGVT